MAKKITLIIVIASMIFPPLFLAPKNAQAQLEALIAQEAVGLTIYTAAAELAAMISEGEGVVEVPVLDSAVVNELAIEKPAAASKETKSKILEALFKLLLELLRRRLLNMLVDQIINWIQGAGQPQFVSNWQGFLNEAFQAAVGDVVLQTDAAGICAPFKPYLRLSLLPVPKFNTQVTCTLDKIVSNINNFYADFRNGGWIAYNAAWQPQNNYYGVSLMTRDQIAAKTAQKTQAAQNEAMSGGGFLSIKRCKGGGYPITDFENNNPPANYVKDYNGNYCTSDKMENITPGGVIGGMTTKAFGSDLDYILSAQELEQYITAIANAAINRMIKEGVAYVRGAPVDTTNYTTGFVTALTGINAQDKQIILNVYQNIINDRQAVQLNKQQSSSSTQQLVVVLKQLQQSGCPPLVSQSDIDNADSKIISLAHEIDDLQTVIEDVGVLKSDSEKLSTDYALNDMKILIDKYNNFINSNSSLMAEVFSGAGKTSSANDAQQQQKALTDAKTKWNTCVVPY